MISAFNARRGETAKAFIVLHLGRPVGTGWHAQGGSGNLTDFITAESVKWDKVAKDAGIQPE